jgi:hypothetical protein
LQSETLAKLGRGLNESTQAVKSHLHTQPAIDAFEEGVILESNLEGIACVSVKPIADERLARHLIEEKVVGDAPAPAPEREREREREMHQSMQMVRKSNRRV